MNLKKCVCVYVLCTRVCARVYVRAHEAAGSRMFDFHFVQTLFTNAHHVSVSYPHITPPFHYYLGSAHPFQSHLHFLYGGE